MTNKVKFEIDEMIEIQNELAVHNVIFQEFWKIGKPIFTLRIKTAAVGFGRSGEVLYLIINPDFWGSLDLENKKFVISHECLHVILNHGKRGENYKNKEDLNKAMDIVINELLIGSFGFNKYDILNWEQLCFVETIFSKELILEKSIHKYGSFDYYYQLMVENETNQEKETVDQHGSVSGESESDMNSNGKDLDINKLIEDAIANSEELNESIYEEVEDKLSNEEKQELGNKIDQDMGRSQAGTNPFGKFIDTPSTPIKKIKKWEEIVRKHVRSIIAYRTQEKESWVARNRKMIMMDEDILIPGEWEEEVPDFAKYNLVFFLDASGSCNAHAQRFVKLLRSIPEEIFEINAYSFDTRIYKIDLKENGVRGCGGTRFSILDDEVRKLTESKKRHPDAIFVLSDGDGDSFYPEKPKLWHWILTPRHSTHYIPELSQKHKIVDFK
jgi:predicted metal-dependent peptidase